MPRGKFLSEFEKGQINALVACGKNNVQIAKLLSRSTTVIRNFINKNENYGKNHKGGRNEALSSRDKNHITRLASNEMISCKEIKTELKLEASKTTVWRCLNSSPNLHHRKLKKKPILAKVNRDRRIKWAIDKVGWNTEWEKIIYSDEKKFNMDGPDGFYYYWHDLRKTQRVLSKRHTSGGGVMVWAAFCNYGRVSLTFCSSKMNQYEYMDLLEKHLLDYWINHNDGTWNFIHDNAPIHSARQVNEFLEENLIKKIDWPPYSPDLNPIENLWGELVRYVYAKGKQFYSIETLKQAIMIAWNEIPLEYFQNLVSSMKSRVANVLLKQGGSTPY